MRLACSIPLEVSLEFAGESFALIKMSFIMSEEVNMAFQVNVIFHSIFTSIILSCFS